MPLVYLTSAVFVVLMIHGVIRAVREKKWTDVFYSLVMLPWLMWMTASFKYGGTAFNDAAQNYEAYLAGHYYLRSGSDYTEVSYEIFQRLRTLQVVGMISWAVGFGGSIMAEILRGNKEPYRPRLGEKQ